MMLFKGMNRLAKALVGLSLAGFLLVLCYSEVTQLLAYSVFHSTLGNYFPYPASFCNSTSNDSPINTTQLYLMLNSTLSSHTNNITNATHPTCPPAIVQQVVIKEQDTDSNKQWHADKFWHAASTFPLCTMDTCFNFSRCADMKHFLIYAYGHPYEPIWYLKELKSSPWLTTDPSEACLFLVTLPQHQDGIRRPHPSTLPYWNGGMNHVIATLADKWVLTGPSPHTIGNASLLSTSLHETTYRPGFDISMPLPGKTHMAHLQGWKAWDRKYFLTFKGLRYLGQTEGNFRSDPALRAMHNGKDVIIAMSCNQVTNNVIRREHPEEGKGCDEDEARFKQHDFMDLMNSTFALAPAGRSSSSYRMIETLSAGAIPIFICDNYVKPFDTIIQWHQCALQFPTSEASRILPTLRALPREEVERRQRYCLFVYNQYLKDDVTLLSAVIKSLKLRFYGVLAQFNEALPTGTRKRRR